MHLLKLGLALLLLLTTLLRSRVTSLGQEDQVPREAARRKDHVEKATEIGRAHV